MLSSMSRTSDFYDVKEKEKIRLAIIQPAPYPAKLPLFDAISMKTQCRVFFFYKSAVNHPGWDIDKILKQSHFEYEFLPGFSISGTHIRPSVFWRLWKFKPEVIVACDFFLQTLFAVLYARLFNAKVLIHSNTTRLSGNVRRRWFRKLLVHFCDGFIAASYETKKYLCGLGAEPNKVFISIQTIDTLKWKSLVDKERKTINKLKEELRLKGKVILYVGRLVSLKGVNFLFEAFHCVTKTLSDVSILLVGSGSEESRLKTYCEQNNLSDKVIFVGYKQPDELPRYYAVADLFVFTTLGDTFGLVVNEALASGLPVICSPFAGAMELIEEGKNGYVVDPHDTEKMAELILKMLKDEDLLCSLKQGALASIENFTIEKSAEQFLNAIYQDKFNDSITR